MGLTQENGPRLVLPLLRLAPDVPGRTDTAPAPRLIALHDQPDEGLVAWAARVREAQEPCLLLDDSARVAAMSLSGALLLDLDPVRSVGSLLLDLLALVDFSSAGDPLPDAQTQAPPLRALHTGGLARGLVRVRRDEELSTYDVVGVPLSGGAGVLAFLTSV